MPDDNHSAGSVEILEGCNRQLHELGHRAGGILMASRILHADGKVPDDILHSYQLLQRVVAGSDETLQAARNAQAVLRPRERK